MFNRFLATFCCLFFTLIACSQDWVDDIKKMDKTYSGAKSMSMNLTVSLFQKVNVSTSLATYSGKMAKAGDDFFSDMMGRITIVNKNTRLMVDKQQQMILYKKNVKKDEKANKAISPLPFSIDSMIRANSTAKYLVNNSFEKRIEIITLDSQYSKIEIVIDPSFYTLKQIVLFDTKNPDKKAPQKIVIDYSNVKIDTKIPAAIFSESKYIDIGFSKVSLTKPYENFQLIDQNNSVNN